MFTVALSLLRCSLCFFSFNRMMSSPTSGDTSVARRQLTVGLSRQSTPNKAASLAKQSQRAIIIEAFYLLWCSVKLATDSNTLTSKAITYRSRIKSFMISNLQNLRVLKSILRTISQWLPRRPIGVKWYVFHTVFTIFGDPWNLEKIDDMVQCAITGLFRIIDDSWHFWKIF